ncbi:MAG: hypothetical protein WAU47_12315 [Desulfobaccales bacterium]
MWRCLEAGLEILVHRGVLYLPLLKDPDIHGEIQARLAQDFSPTSLPALVAVQDRLFVQAVSASSLIDHYPRIYPQEHENRRRLLLEQYSLSADLWGINLDPKLITIVFHILPHFMRRDGLPQRQRLGEGNILDLIRERVPVPSKFREEARRFLDVKPLQEALQTLTTAALEATPPPEGLMPAAGLRAWWQEAQAVRILAEARARLLEALEDREQWAAAQEGRLAVLLYLADTGSLELDGFGFTRLKQGSDYRVYKRTGPYALKDFYGRLYLFPDCRVAVTTFGRLRPVVVDHYKHPFLRQHGSGQPICVGSEHQNLIFSAKNVIQALEEGINALLYSYDSRQRRGYHKLDTLPGSMRLVDFEDYRIPQDHPLIVSGQVEVKNRTA